MPKDRPTFMKALRASTELPGEQLKDFSAQYKALTDQDKLELSAYMTASGIDHDPPKFAVVQAQVIG